MSSWVLHVLALVIALNVVSAETVDDASREETERIINGKEAAPGQFRYTVALYYKKDFMCTASVISSSAVLTAAHCVIFKGKKVKPESLYGIRNVSRSAGSVRIEFSKVIPHPEYSTRGFANDIAILQTKGEIELGNGVESVDVACPETDKKYKKATAMGWGDTNPTRMFTEMPDRLHYVEEKIVSNFRCSWSFSLWPMNDGKICTAGHLNGICSGDSGGPLVHDSKRKPVQIGIASYINGYVECWSATAAVFTRVSSYYDFIKTNGGNVTECKV